MANKVAPVPSTQTIIQPSPPTLTCSICIEDITPGKNHVVTKCGHDFHADCYTDFILSTGGKKKCPNCRNELHSGVTRSGTSADRNALKAEVENELIERYNEIFIEISSNMASRKKTSAECIALIDQCSKTSRVVKQKLDLVKRKLQTLI